MSDLFIPSSFILDEYNTIIHQDLRRKEEQIQLKDKTNMRGYVYAIHETKDGKKELLNHNHNHIVLSGRKWLMQRAIGASIESNKNYHNYSICWFGLGAGGVASHDPLNPLYTPDQIEDLKLPIQIKGSDPDSSYVYDNSGYKKTFLKDENGANAQMKYSSINSEVLALFHLVVDYNDCPYTAPNLGVKISEMGLYCAASENSSEDDFVLFSRYCLATKIKSQSDKLTFLWYVYF